MRSRKEKKPRLIYLVFLVPFILAYFSWAYFPVFASWLTTTVFSYSVPERVNGLWYLTARFFYTWYTFLAIGVTGVWVLATMFVSRRQKRNRELHYPMVSIVVPAYNEEKNISRCIDSLFKCTAEYNGLCEIIVVDDGSGDLTYEAAWAAIALGRRKWPRVRAKVVRHSANLGKDIAVKTGVDKTLGSIIAVVDADSWWMPKTLAKLVDHMLLNGKKAVTGYVHPSDGDSELNPYVVLQQLEYSQGLGISRCAQSLGNDVLVVPGAIGLYDAETLRAILSEKDIHSVTEDLEITLEMHRRGADVGYTNTANSLTISPLSFSLLWNQRLRWFIGWLHNTLEIHSDLLFRKSWLTLFLWSCYIFEYFGAFADLAALTALPLLFWFAPDRILFLLNLLVFVPYGFLIGITSQAIALKQAYKKHNYKSLLFYTPFYPILRLINVLARLTSSAKYLLGDHGNWHDSARHQHV
ncbi:MAG: glycosyltransferase [Nitrososphaeria archaeon]|nr:glycosyltransferase [Nitrososphaeria archaeon]